MILQIEEKIKQILIAELEIEACVVASCDSSTPLLGRGIGPDSVETLTLAAGIEKEFGIQIDDADLTLDLFKSIGSLAEFVLEKIEQKSS